MDYYGTFAGYQAYHTARGRDVSDQSEGAVLSALLVASEWLDGSFSWPGYQVGARADQMRSWPRSYVLDRAGYSVDHLVVPVEIEYATYEAAFRHIADADALVADYSPQQYKRVSVDGAISVEYRLLDAATVQKQFPIIGNILSRLLGGSSVSSLSSGTVRA